MGSNSLLQGIFPTQRQNLGLSLQADFFFFFFLSSETPRKHVIVFIFVLIQVEGKYNVKYLDEIELHSEFKDELHSRRPTYENT